MASGWDLWVSLEPDGQQVPALSLTFPNPKVTRVCPSSGGTLQHPGVLGPGRGAHRDGTAGVPPRDGDRALKAKFGFFLFFPFPFVMMMIFTVT